MTAPTPDAAARRTRSTIIAGVVIVVVAIALLMVVRGGSEPAARWGIVGSGEKRSLVIRTIDPTNCAAKPEVEVLKANSNRIELRVTQPVENCDTGGRVQSAPITVRLPVPLRGQTIDGPGYRGKGVAMDATAEGRPYPSLVGLRVTVARLVLEANGTGIQAITGSTGTAAEVTQQSPPAGQLVPLGLQAPPATLRTVPR